MWRVMGGEWRGVRCGLLGEWRGAELWVVGDPCASTRSTWSTWSTASTRSTLSTRSTWSTWSTVRRPLALKDLARFSRSALKLVPLWSNHGYNQSVLGEWRRRGKSGSRARHGRRGAEHLRRRKYDRRSNCKFARSRSVTCAQQFKPLTVFIHYQQVGDLLLSC